MSIGVAVFCLFQLSIVALTGWSLILLLFETKKEDEDKDE